MPADGWACQGAVQPEPELPGVPDGFFLKSQAAEEPPDARRAGQPEAAGWGLGRQDEPGREPSRAVDAVAADAGRLVAAGAGHRAAADAAPVAGAADESVADADAGRLANRRGVGRRALAGYASPAGRDLRPQWAGA